MDMKLVPVADIQPAPYNPRVDLQPGMPEYEKLKRSVREFGLVEPMVWNRRTGNLVGGHQRLKVYLDLHPEAEAVPCIVVDLPLEREKALNVALNRIEGEWDQGKLAALLAELEDSSIDATLTGFDPNEIDLLLTGFRVEQAFEALDEVIEDEAEAPADEPEVSEGRGLGNPVITYNVVFDNEQQQAVFHGFIRWLKQKYPDEETLGARLERYITENGVQA